MSRHLSTETFQLDLRSSPSQQHLDPSRSSSLASQRDEMDPPISNEKSHKLDLYSIPVFLLEVIVLLGLAYLAQFAHFQYHHEPLITGFYCDDISYRQHYVESKFTHLFSQKQNEITVVALLLAVPIVLVIFCELVNSMFGALKFRQIRALCTCCKLHSITRRTIRFSGAYALGFLIVVISCDILATTTGRLRPYFAQECTSAYQQCATLQAQSRIGDLSALQSSMEPSTHIMTVGATGILPTDVVTPPSSSLITPPSAPILSISNSTPAALYMQNQTFPITTNPGESSRIRQASTILIAERHWIDLTGQNLSEICLFAGESEASYKFNQIAMSWPSFPAAIFTYACLFLSCYLAYVGTARPFRIITSVLIVLLILLAAVFDVQLVKEHYNHWDDVAAGAVISFIVVVFVLMVYLNKFRDTHYYQNQKLFKSKHFVNDTYLRGYSNDGAVGQYNLDKTSNGLANNSPTQNGNETGGTVSNNDLAMRYFQIPRANYRGAPRPLSSLNQMR